MGHQLIRFFHLLGVVLWMGGLLVVSRLLAEPAAGERLEPVERRLFGSFIHGGAALVIASGILLILDQPSVLRQGWLHAKLLVVLGLVAADARLYRRMQAQHASPGSVTRAGALRLHGWIAAGMVAVLALAVLRPF
ncbi:MAG: hypothetical protein E6J55_01065 [Deltaproteobacteria bacterium]|nr:MAG: hypothetical protein E6J55_01065 [Deltaproteobacteria bacterium]